MKRRTWSRPKKTARNLLAAVVLLLICWLLSGFAPLTKGMLAADVARRNLLSGAEIIHEGESWQGYPMMYLQKDDAFLQVVYARQAGTPFYGSWEAWLYTGSGGVVCLPDQREPGVLLALGNVDGAERAELDVTGGLSGRSAFRWTAEGERLSDHAFAFALTAGTTEEEQMLDVLRKTACPEEIYNWTLRLYGGDGELLRTLTGPEG